MKEISKKQKEFEELMFRSREAKNHPKSRYRVYKVNKEFIEVEAGSAAEAIRVSGIEKPLRIQRHEVKLQSLIHASQFNATPAEPEAVVPAESEAVAPAQEAETAPPPEQDASAPPPAATPSDSA